MFSRSCVACISMHGILTEKSNQHHNHHINVFIYVRCHWCTLISGELSFIFSLLNLDKSIQGVPKDSFHVSVATMDEL